MSWKLLIVDDEPANLEIIGEFLDDPVFNLSFAANGEEAWTALLAADPPIDVIVLDRMMPVLNGMELLKRVKADARFHNLPVIMQTAASDPAQVKEGLDAGAYYYLTKPYQPAALISIVEAAIDELVLRQVAISAIANASGGIEIGPDFASPLVIRFAALDEAHQLAGSLANLCPDPAAAAMGLTELLVNAIEHGNL